jgi:predicted CopG family antitoxin
MTDTSIRVSEETKARLETLKRSDESFDDLLGRLTNRERWAGFGVLSDADPETFRDRVREAHEDLEESLEASEAAMDRARRHVDRR